MKQHLLADGVGVATLSYADHLCQTSSGPEDLSRTLLLKISLYNGFVSVLMEKMQLLNYSHGANRSRVVLEDMVYFSPKPWCNTGTTNIITQRLR